MRMKYRTFAALIFCAFGLWTTSVLAAEKVAIKIGGQTTRWDVVSLSKDNVTLRSDGKEQTLPLGALEPAEVANCLKNAPNPNARLRMELGAYLVRKKQADAGKAAIESAVAQDPSLKLEADRLLSDLFPTHAAPAENPLAGAPKGGTDKITGGNEKDKDKDKDTSPPKDDSKRGNEDFATRFGKRTVPARSPEEMKAFIEKRLKELNDVIGGSWRMVETPHFYCFANIPEAKHKQIATAWNEQLFYDRLSSVLRHKEGDKLWNNKCPVYYFERFSQFQKYAAVIDRQPGAGNSGGYFSAEGRDVHICIPFMSEQLNSDVAADQHARNTVVHEGTHAFLQLAGEDVTLNKWLHEGLAQFMEFWVEREGLPQGQYGKERNGRATYLCRLIRQGELPSWSEMKDRPQGGTDLTGYAFAWARTEYLYRRFDNQCLPNMIKAIKSGKTEADAIKAAFGQTIEKLEQDYLIWIKEVAKKGFRFE